MTQIFGTRRKYLNFDANLQNEVQKLGFRRKYGDFKEKNAEATQNPGITTQNHGSYDTLHTVI